MAGIHHERDQRGGKRRKGGGQQLDCHKLHGTGVYKYTHKQGPAIGDICVMQQDAEGHSQENISHHNRKRIRNGGFQRFSFHDSFTSAVGLYELQLLKNRQFYGSYFYSTVTRLLLYVLPAAFAIAGLRKLPVCRKCCRPAGNDFTRRRGAVGAANFLRWTEREIRIIIKVTDAAGFAAGIF